MENDNKLKVKLKELSKNDKEEFLTWAIEVQKIQNNKQISRKQKIYDLKRLNNKRAFINVTSFMWEYVSEKWKKSNLSTKLMLIGGGIGLSLAGVQGAGIAALGSAIGVPLFLVTAAGGALIGNIIKMLNNNQNKE